MKILIVNHSDVSGGAARAAYRLHRGLLEHGIDSKMLVQQKTTDDYTVIGPTTKIEKLFAKIRPTLDSLPVSFYKNRIQTPFSPSWLPFSNIVKKIRELKPDIVHLHWICGGLLRIEDIAKIKAPVVWSLHDNWGFTGGCHIKWECEKYKVNCGACPRLGSRKLKDLSYKVFKRKKKTFSKKNLTIVGLSRWVYEESKNSSLLKNHHHINLPNPIDTQLFKPFDRQKAKELWGLPNDKRLVLFGANSAMRDINKGFKELSQALHLLDKKLNIEFLIFGSSKPRNAPDLGFDTHYVGHLYDDVSLITLYSAADVMVVPSLQENLSNTIMESLSCGTPVVAFDVGGNSDMIEHQKNGYLAKPFDVNDLKDGIEWVLNASNYDELCYNAREKIVKEFDSSVVTKKYIELYEEILNGRF